MGFWKDLLNPVKATEDIFNFGKNVTGDITKGIGQAGHQLGQWAGDLEHGFSQVTHNPYVRSAEEIAAAIAAAYLGQEYLVPYLTDAAAAEAGMTAADAGLTAADTAAATSYGADLAAETAVAAPEAAAAAAPAAAGAATAADAATSAIPGAMQELTVSAQALPYVAQPGALSTLFPGATLLAQNALANPQQAVGPRADVKAQGVPDSGAPPPLDLSAVAGPGGAVNLPDVLTPEMGATPLVAPSAISGPMGTELPQEGEALSQTDVGPQPSFAQSMMDYLKTPKGALTAGMLGMSGLSALSKPKLPGAAQQAAGLAGPAAAQAQGIISSGGYSAPGWQQQKASIDAQVNQEIADATRAMQQNAQNAGMGGANSDVVQQQIASIKDRAETQRQMLYAQALQQNVNNAVAELTGADQTLMGVAELQYQQSAQARTLAAQLAQDAAWLNVAGGSSTPSAPVGG